MEVSQSVYRLEIYPNEARQDVVSFPLHLPISAEENRLLLLGRFAFLVTVSPQSELPRQNTILFLVSWSLLKE